MHERYILTDYWDEERKHRPYRNVLRDPRTDKPVTDGDAIEAAIKEAEVKCGDEFEVIIRKTGRRPFGDRKVRLVKPHIYRREKRAARRRT